jgi:hypothetical protein
VAFDAGVKKVALSISSAADIPIIPVELFTKFQTRFYADPVDGIIAVLGFDRRIVDLDGTQIIVFNLYGSITRSKAFAPIMVDNSPAGVLTAIKLFVRATPHVFVLEPEWHCLRSHMSRPVRSRCAWKMA